MKIFYLKKRVVFPYCTLTVVLKLTEDTKSIKGGDQLLAYTVRTLFDVVWYRNRIATLSEVVDVAADGQSVKVTLKGIARARIERIIKFKHADFTILEKKEPRSNDAIMDELRKKSQELIFLINVDESDKLINLLNFIVDLNQMTDFISNYFIMDFRKRYGLYNTIDIKKRGQVLITELDYLIDKMAKKRKKTYL
jgi:ATP-dependent Lon protease